MKRRGGRTATRPGKRKKPARKRAGAAARGGKPSASRGAARAGTQPRGAGPGAARGRTSEARSKRPRGRPVPPAAERIGEIVARLQRRYPDARCSLDHRDPLELLVATILSAQCTDARVNVVTQKLFRKYRTAGDYAATNPAVFEDEIRSTGFFRNKTKSVIGMAQGLLERFGSLAGVQSASTGELAAVPGISHGLAERILAHLAARS